MAEIERRKGPGESPKAKRVKQSISSSSGDGDCPWTAFGVENVDKIDSPEDAVAKSVDHEIEHFRALAVSSASLTPHDVLKYGNREGGTRFKYLRSVAQQVLGDQAFAAQIERDFSGEGQLLSGRKSRMDVSYVEMLLFHLNFDSIPYLIPAIKSSAIRELLPKRFTGRDAEVEAAETFRAPDVAYTDALNEEK